MSTPDPFITIFTAPKPFTNPHINLIQRNAIHSWQHLGDGLSIVLMGNEPGIAEFSRETGLLHLPDVEINFFGTPLVSSLFSQAHQVSASPILAYVNADILLTPNFVTTATQVYCQLKRFLIVGQRHDLNVQQSLEFSSGWNERLLSDLQSHGRLHPPAGSDYFIFPHMCFTEIPEFTIGRAGWDNWMIYSARLQHIPVVDATGSITVIHQDHDYSHLPDGKPHYRLPESAENLRLSGGRRTVFTLADADHTFAAGQVQPTALHLRKLMREIEIFPLIQLQSKSLASMTFAIFHPRNAWREFKGRAVYGFKRDRATHD